MGDGVEEEDVEEDFEDVEGLGGQEEEGVPDDAVEGGEKPKYDPVGQPVLALLAILVRQRLGINAILP